MERARLSHKGMAIGDLTNIAYAFVLIGVAIAIGVWINSQIESTAYSLVTVKCEAVTWTANNTYQFVAYPYIKSVDYMYNASTCAAATLMLSGNYTNTEQAIYLQGTGIPFGASLTKYVNYTAWDTVTSPDKLISKNATAGISNIAQWMPIIAVVMAAGIIIAALMGWFAMRREQEV